MLETDRILILKSITEVGRSKAIGYLPTNTIERILKVNTDWIEKFCSQNGLRFRVFSEEQTCIKSGAIFVWSEKMLVDVLSRARRGDQLDPMAPDDFVQLIATEWYDDDHYLMATIRRAFNDENL